MNTSSLRLALLALFALSLGALTVATPQDAEAQVVIPGDTGGDDDEKKTRKPRKKRCPDGQVRNEDTDGECCWPGQVYSNDRCIGIPTECPDGYLASGEQQSCVLPTCENGKVRVEDVYCCWPGQAYSKTRSQCVGVPQCPDGLSVEGEDCVGDTDGDGLIADDRCPEKAEDIDGFEDEDGCPDLDNDEDTVADADDQCPAEAEDLDGYLDEDGCPDLDNDEDGIADAQDDCPDKAGTEDKGGCPDDEVVTGPGDGGTTPERPSSGVSGMTIGGWVAIGVGVILAGAGGGLMAAAAGKRGEVEDATVDENGITTGLTRSEALALESDANTFDTIGVLSIGLGGAAIVTGVVLLLLDEGEADTTISGAIGPNGEGLVIFGGRF